MFTTSRKHLGALAFGRSARVLLWGAAAVVITLNIWMLQRLMTT
jgi:manganese transport protein